MKKIITLKMALLIFLGCGRGAVKYAGSEFRLFDKLLIGVNASPLVTPFLGYSRRLELKKFFNYQIDLEDGSVLHGDHFDRVHQLGGLHVVRVALLDEVRDANKINVRSISPRLCEFYCEEKHAGQNVVRFRVLGTNWLCPKLIDDQIRKCERQ